MTTHPATRPAEVEEALRMLRVMAVDSLGAQHALAYITQLETGNAPLRAALKDQADRANASVKVARALGNYHAEQSHQENVDRINAALAATSAPNAGWRKMQLGELGSIVKAYAETFPSRNACADHLGIPMAHLQEMERDYRIVPAEVLAAIGWEVGVVYRPAPAVHDGERGNG